MADRGEILFLAHRVPFPPDRGDRIRSWHVLRALAAHAQVHLGCIAETPPAADTLARLDTVVASRCIAPRRASLGWAGIAALASGRPVSVAAFASAQLAAWVARTLAERPITAIYVFSGQMAQFVPAWFAGRVVMDFVDVDSAKYAAIAQTARSTMVRWIHAREARVLARFEAAVARRATVSLLVTAAERALFVARIGAADDATIAVLGNGIDFAHFAPGAVAPEASLGASAGPAIVFTGQMDYAPNVAAVVWFAREVLPLIRARAPHAVFAIVGRAPSGEVRALAAEPGVIVTGEVADVRPWLSAADLVTAPLMIARGVQNKVLEAMAMARPVLLSAAAAEGIAAQDGTHFVIAEDADAFAARALALLDDRAAAATLGQAAREWVCSEGGWDQALAGLPAIMGWTDGQQRA